MNSSSSFIRAHEMYLSPSDGSGDCAVQFEGFFIFKSVTELSDLNLGKLDSISWFEAEVSEEDDHLRIWVTAWLDTDGDGEYDKKDLGDLQGAEIVDTQNIRVEPDPDQEWDSRGEWD